MKLCLESDAKAYHDYYLHQARKGYPVYARSRYQERPWTRKYFRWTHC